MITLIAGVPNRDKTIFHRIRFDVGDMAAWIGGLPGGSLLFIRDIEMDRAREFARADRITCSAEYAPAAGLSGDRDTAMAQAVAECLRKHEVTRVTTDRTLPFIFAAHLQEVGISLDYDPQLGVDDRRVKDASEITAMRKVQQQTMGIMERACRFIATAEPDADGFLHQHGEAITSESLRRNIDLWFMEIGLLNPHGAIAASIPEVADCHHRGAGPFKTGLPVLLDLFPHDPTSGYNGDCSRTVVHGTPTPEFVAMHEAVVAAKAAGCAALGPGTSGAAVHAAVVAELKARGFAFDRNPDDIAIPHMPHGTGHGIGLDVHEPILLDEGAGEIREGEVFTVEPGLYSSTFGGVRVEDMVLVTPDGPEILGELSEDFRW